MAAVVGGGAKKVLYTLGRLKEIGFKNSGKALRAKNACKACGLGMGGQLGGMTNEKMEFPSVCNKSVQAQSTDIQTQIPDEVFTHTLSDLAELSAKELEHIGRLNTPIYKSKLSGNYTPISWDAAFDLVAQRFSSALPEQSFFYSSGRSSNEAAFILQLFARLYGTNNVNNCSYYCHQATGVGLASTIGKGTSTVELRDLEGCDLFFLIGANPASNHPRLLHQLKGIRDRGGDVVVINPAKEPGLVRFAVPKSPSSLIKGGDYIASFYLQPRIGSDLWLLKGIAKTVLDLAGEDQEFIESHTLGFEAFKRDIQETTWEEIEKNTGVSRAEVKTVGKSYLSAKNVVFAWGMGVTHHLNGSKNVEYIANLALLRGMVGKRFAGLLPLRGHSNIQGVGSIGFKPLLSSEVIARLERNLEIELPQKTGMDTMACLDAAERGEIKNAFILGGNLYSATPDTKWAARAMSRIDFKVFLTTTLNKGHIEGHEESESLVLPVAARDEETQETTQESMFNFVRLSSGGITRLSNVRSEYSIISEIGRRIIPRSVFDLTQFSRHSNVRAAIAASIPGMEELKDIDVSRQEFHIRNRLLHEPKFEMEQGKAHFITHPSDELDFDVEYPYTLMSVRSEGQFNSIIYEENDSYRSVENRESILTNQEDVVRLGVSEGDKLDVISRTGQMKSLEIVLFDVPLGNAMVYYPEANVLVGRNIDERSRTPAFKSIPAKLVPVTKDK